MSLLMDALKKAEQEKKEAAKRHEETNTPAAEGEVKAPSDKLDDTNTWEHEIHDPDNTAEIPSANDTGLHSTTAELELEPITNTDDTAELPSMAGASVDSPELEDPTLNVTMNELSLADLSAERIALDDDADDQPETVDASMAELQSDDVDLDETFHGVSLDDTAVNPELFQETVQGEAFIPDDIASETWGETLPGIPAEQLARDIGSDDQPTPVAAQTVFAASSTTHSSGTGFKWGIAILLFIFLAAGSVYYYFTVTPTNRALLSPQIAQGIERVGPPLTETLDLRLTSPDTGVLAGAVTPPVETGTEREQVQGMNEEHGAETTAAVAEAVVEADSSTQSTEASEVDTELATETPETAASAAETEEQLAMAALPASSPPASLPETIPAQEALIKISRRTSTDDKGKTLRDAYFAYQKGAYGTAEEMYRKTLEQYPENRDALLGLGAIASNSGDYQSAYNMYARVLRSNPRDRFARAALINLQDRAYLANSESEITTMLHDSPDQHFLHFTLGNIYASSNRWAQAQQSFFDAYRLNSSNPDYALNLAISLDHIGQYQAALDYYNVALELANTSTAGFNSTAIEKRVAELNTLPGS